MSSEGAKYRLEYGTILQFMMFFDVLNIDSNATVGEWLKPPDCKSGSQKDAMVRIHPVAPSF